MRREKKNKKKTLRLFARFIDIVRKSVRNRRGHNLHISLESALVILVSDRRYFTTGHQIGTVVSEE